MRKSHSLLSWRTVIGGEQRLNRPFIIGEQHSTRQDVQQVKRTAVRTADDGTDALSNAAIFAFIGLVIGAVTASFGGKTGKPNDLAAVPPSSNNPPVIR